MKAAFFEGDKNIEIREVDKPAREENEIILKVKACGLCGSERKVWTEGTDLIPGHEIAGEIVETGSETDIEKGKKASVYIPFYCDDCSYCRNGDTNLCLEENGLIGWSTNGGYSEYISIPQENAILLDDDMSFMEGVLLLDTIGTTHHAIRQVEFENKDSALVIGCGPIGLGTIYGLKNLGMKRVFGMDLLEKRREFAKKLGAVPIKISRDEKVSDVISEKLDTDLPLIIDCVGSSKTIDQSIDILSPGGDIVVLGEQATKWEISGGILTDMRITRSWYFPWNEIERNKQIIRDDPNISEKLISHTFPLENMEEACNIFFEKGDTAKVIIKL